MWGEKMAGFRAVLASNWGRGDFDVLSPLFIDNLATLLAVTGGLLELEVGGEHCLQARLPRFRDLAHLEQRLLWMDGEAFGEG